LEDTRWLEELYKSNYELLYHVGLLFAGPDASCRDAVEDQISEVFLLAWKKRAQLKNHPNIVGWLVEALRRRLLANFRQFLKEQKKRGFSLDNDKDPSGKAESLFSAAEDFQALWDKERKKLLEELLGRENAALFLLYCVERIPAGELTQRFGVTEDCLRMRVSRMKKKILEHPEIFSAVTLLLVRFLTCFDIKG
jgi:RNA polymerase sigma factor (sigma-70 family)